MATFGDIRFQLSKMHPGVDHDLLDGWILDAYQHALAELDWQRLDATVSIAVPAEYAAGTVALTAGSNAITGTGTTFTGAMTGRLFRASTDGPYYQFTYVSATSGTLDRPYEGATASGAAYRIAQTVFTLPSDCRAIIDVDGLGLRGRTDFPPTRPDHGKPAYWRQTMDSFTDPPAMQIEVYPIPVEAQLLAVTFTAEALPATLDPATGLLPWMHPAALKAYVNAHVALIIEKSIPLYESSMAALAVHIKQMRSKEIDGWQPQEMRPKAAPHRVQRNTVRRIRR
jgi:hypothetical protein